MEIEDKKNTNNQLPLVSERRNSTTQNRGGPINYGLNQPIYFIKTYNGYHLIDPILIALGWKRCIASSQIDTARLRWSEISSQINYSTFRDSEQMVNHFPNCGIITNKLGLLMCLRQYEQQIKATKNRLPNLLLRDIIPETYVVSDYKERELFTKAFTPGSIWISKPTGMNQGKGIYLVRNLEIFLKQMEEKDQEARLNPRSSMPRIVQRYITNPLLLDGRKFDIRCFMLIANSYPYLVLYHPGYVRLSMQKYSPNDTNLVTHLTNQFIQKKHPRYHEVCEDTVWSMKQMNDYINEHFFENKKCVDKNWVYTWLEYRMQRIMSHVFNTVRSKLATRVGFFELFGFDFMVDTDFKVWLIEVNTNPALHTNCRVLMDVLPPLMEKSLFVSLECFERTKKKRALLPLSGLVPWSDNTLKRVTNQDNLNRDSFADSSKLYDWIRNPFNGLPTGFVVLVNESAMLAQMRGSQCMSIPLRAWAVPRFYIPPQINADSSSSSSQTDTDSSIQTNVLASQKPPFIKKTVLPSFGSTVPYRESNNILEQPNTSASLVGIRNRSNTKTKQNISIYKEHVFEQSLRKYPQAPSTAKRLSNPMINTESFMRPMSTDPTSSRLDKKVEEVYRSTIHRKIEETEKLVQETEPLPSPLAIIRRNSRPVRQAAINGFSKVKREYPTRVPVPMTTVQVVTNGSSTQTPDQVGYQVLENVTDDNGNSIQQRDATELVYKSKFPQRRHSVKNNGLNILQFLDVQSDIGNSLNKDLKYKSVEERRASLYVNQLSSEKARKYIDRSC